MIKPPSFVTSLLLHPVAVFGAGVSGVAACELVTKLGGRGTLFDERGGDGVEPEFKVGSAETHRLVIYSPGFAPTHTWLSVARAHGCTCLGELDFASLFWRGLIVAVTGTNGKTTLTEFLTHALRSVGKDAVSAGNIGYSFSKLVLERGGGGPESIAVCEVSSFQAETFRYFRADAAIWTNFAEDHLERHGSMDDYFAAKWRLLERSVGGHVFVGSSVKRAVEQHGQTLPEESVVNTEPEDGDILLRGTVFAHQPQRENFLLAAAWWRQAGYRETALYAAAQSFRLGEHRLARVKTVKGVTWWNDSKATNFHAVEAALSGFATPVLLIAGGKSKGGDFAGFANRIASKVKKVYLIGDTRHVLATLLAKEGVNTAVCGDLKTAVITASREAQEGDQVLLSPAFASFDQFRNYQDRGEQFARLVNDLENPSVLL